MHTTQTQYTTRIYSPDTDFCGYTLPHPSDDLIKIRNRYDESILKGITFKTVKHLDEAIEIVFV